MEAARDLGQPPTQIMEDLNRLWMCGLPGLLPGDLVELEHDFKQVKIYNAQGMDKPLRLTPTEAGVLLLTLESLESLPGIAQQDAVVTAAQKLRVLMGEHATTVFDSTGEDLGVETLSTIREAMDQHKQVSFQYHSHKSDNTSIRNVSPGHIFTHEGETYIKAWEQEAADWRTFRLDRIHDIILLDVAAVRPRKGLKVSTADPFEFAKASDIVTFLLREDAMWLANYMAMYIATDAEPHHDSSGSRWYTVVFPLLSREWFIRFAIGHAEHLKVIAPKDLKKCINQKAINGLSAYDRDVE